MENVKLYLNKAWDWLKTRQKATLLAGAAIGAVVDGPIIKIIDAIF